MVVRPEYAMPLPCKVRLPVPAIVIPPGPDSVPEKTVLWPLPPTVKVTGEVFASCNTAVPFPR